ncbi:oxidoreductase [Acrocarpospora phusangensis]|uniref:Oxidoreductase n=1 Tax=Acrocarpospora phusangensis TaxID=1070424 RepID=A0A919UQ45_9ACTN|nr:FAD-binding protein [Acrocarpospora phusangensis]GIH26432.1 oxidoreductase [Acrocarpospora phusangensis]
MNDFSALRSELRKVVRGQVHVAGDAGFDAARSAWDTSVEQRVRAVVEVADAADAAALVRYAREAGIGVATQPLGHAPSSFDDAILVRTKHLSDIQILPDQRLAKVGSGALWTDVLAQSAKHGLTGLAGSTTHVSATGFTLGGGVSWFGRKHGFAANHVRAFEVVDADGVQRRVTADSDPDLFWALRGGGGDFALVTSLEFDLFPSHDLYGGRILWPAARAREVMAAFREVTASAPEELSTWFSLIQFPPFPELPEPLRGLSAVAIDVTYLGATEEAAGLLAAFDRVPGAIMDTRGQISAAHLGDICAEPTEPTAAVIRTELLTHVDEEISTALLTAAGPGTVAPMAVVQVRHLGGALSRAADSDGACGHLPEPYLLFMVGILPFPELAGPVEERRRSIVRAVAPALSGRRPFTFLGHSESAESAFPPATLDRLRAIKTARDPQSVFRSNHPVHA